MGTTVDTIGKLQILMRGEPVSLHAEYDPDAEQFMVMLDAEAMGAGKHYGEASTLIGAIGRAHNSLTGT